MRALIHSCAIALLLACTSGCGQKGPLYLPDKTHSTVPSRTQPATTPAAQPADSPAPTR